MEFNRRNFFNLLAGVGGVAAVAAPLSAQTALQLTHIKPPLCYEYGWTKRSQEAAASAISDRLDEGYTVLELNGKNVFEGRNSSNHVSGTHQVYLLPPGSNYELPITWYELISFSYLDRADADGAVLA